MTPRLDHRPSSLIHLLVDRAADTPDACAYQFPMPEGQWGKLTWAETLRRVTVLAAGLLTLGVRPEMCVAIASSTRVEWILADLATMSTGATTTAVHSSANPSETAFVLGDSASRVLFAENDEQLAKVLAQQDRLPELTAVVLIEGQTEPVSGLEVLSLAELEVRGGTHLAEDPQAVAKTMRAVERDHLATIMYTSGTTGQPKGVRLVHDSWSYAALAQREMNLFRADDVHFLWLPLAHVYGKTLIAGQIATGHMMVVDGRADLVASNLATIHPTITALVPRVLVKMHNEIVAGARGQGRLRRLVFAWAARIARDYSRAAGTASPVLRVQHAIADRMVYPEIRAVFGGRLRGALCGGVLLDPEISHFFVGAGVPILETYGLTETSAGIAISRHETARVGTVGPPFPQTEIRIAADGEIFVRGPGVMTGYHNLPSQTAEVLDAHGWLSTGDIGEVDDHGNLLITDRKKDLFKTSGGTFVAPGEIEGAFKALCPLASNIVVVGNGRSHCTALISLDSTVIMPWAARQDIAGAYADVVAHPRTAALVQLFVDALNARLQSWQTIRNFTLLPREFTMENGDLTPSLKVKRRNVEMKYAAEIDSMYLDD